MVRARSRAAALAATLGLLAVGAVPAAAQDGASTPPPLGDTAAPGVRPPPTSSTTQQSGPCLTGSAVSGPTTAPLVSPAQAQLGYPQAWTHGRGEGVTVAVIDTGVSPSSRLSVVPGGDYVSTGDGTADCDGHGSIVAGIIAARPSPLDTYVGVAPGATILSIRQYSALYRATDAPGATGRTRNADGFGNLDTLAAAVVWAASSGAQVINISEAACGTAGAPLAGDQELGAALRYAVDERDAVVVAAAGNGPDTTCATTNDPLGLSAPRTVASPAWWDDYVLTVGSVDPDGTPSEFSIAGPWVDVAAPGTDVVGLNPVPGASLVDLLREEPIQGTSFSTPYVSGTVALVRQRFPDLSARQVAARIEATAHAPAGGRNDRVGHGIVDPVAAVENVPDVLEPRPPDTASTPVEAVAPPTPASTTPRTVALVGSGIALGALLLARAVVDVLQRDRRAGTSRRSA